MFPSISQAGFIHLFCSVECDDTVNGAMSLRTSFTKEMQLKMSVILVSPLVSCM